MNTEPRAPETEKLTERQKHARGASSTAFVIVLLKRADGEFDKRYEIVDASTKSGVAAVLQEEYPESVGALPIGVRHFEEIQPLDLN